MNPLLKLAARLDRLGYDKASELLKTSGHELWEDDVGVDPAEGTGSPDLSQLDMSDLGEPGRGSRYRRLEEFGDAGLESEEDRAISAIDFMKRKGITSVEGLEEFLAEYGEPAVD